MSPDTYLVAVEAPLREPLSYLPPDNSAAIVRGQPVLVPLGKRQVRGVVLNQSSKPDVEFKLKPIAEIDERRPIIPETYLLWAEWLARYYIHPVGQVIGGLFPPLKKESRGSRKTPVAPTPEIATSAPALTDEQRRVLDGIPVTDQFHVHLIHGVTGSGKTEVYLDLFRQALGRGKRGLLLVPEIALTPQLIARVSSRFPGEVAVLHSHLTEREKTDQWWSIVDGRKKILIGARSALFCPMPDLGVIVLDEEHEPSYKQDEKLKYHARDAAIMLAKNLNVPIVLGSATPSLESWSNAQSGKFRLHQMSSRVNQRALPDVSVIDLRQVFKARKEKPSELPYWLSDKLYLELNETWAKGEQAALFLNRRGVAQTAQCHACGYVAECLNCSVSLTVHAKSHLVCHYCDYTESLKEICPECREPSIEALGLGTERVEDDMRALFPDLRIARADRDEIQSRDQLEKLILEMEKREIDLLIGTQMIAKGLDFPSLNLVGLILADISFHLPDFRAGERSFQLLTQVSGRSGRQSAGRVVIQTYNPDHVSVQFTVAGDYPGFANAELQERSELFYPPFWRMGLFRVQGQTLEVTERAAQRLVARAETLQREASTKYGENLIVLGPAPAPLFKLRGKFRYQVMVKCDSSSRLNAFCRQLLANEKWIPAGTKVQVDIDPFQML